MFIYSKAMLQQAGPLAGSCNPATRRTRATAVMLTSYIIHSSNEDSFKTNELVNHVIYSEASAINIAS